jgi:hypothetical protein
MSKEDRCSICAILFRTRAPKLGNICVQRQEHKNRKARYNFCGGPLFQQKFRPLSRSNVDVLVPTSTATSFPDEQMAPISPVVSATSCVFEEAQGFDAN